MTNKIDFLYELLEKLEDWEITFNLSNWDSCKDERINLLIKENYKNMLTGYKILLKELFEENGKLLKNLKSIQNKQECKVLVNKTKNAISIKIYLIKYKNKILYYGEIINKDNYQEIVYGICD